MTKRGRARAGRRRDRQRSVGGSLQDVVSPRLREARTLWMQGRQAEALDRFEQAIRFEPRNIRAVVDAARAYATRFDFRRAETLLDRLRGLAPEQPGVHHLAGDTYSRLKLLPQAVACYERAGSLPGALPATWVELASLYERANRLQEAAELVQRALHSQPGMPLALFVQAQLQRRAGELDAGEASLRQVIAATAAPADLYCRAWAEIAALHDRRGEYDEAMSAIQHCKTALLSRGAADWNASERVLGRYQQMIAAISTADLQRWQAQAKDLDQPPVALLTGFPRSGTTLLEQVLDAHPGLVSSEERDFVGQELLPSLQRDISTTAPLLDVLHQVNVERLQRERERYFAVMEWMLGEPISGRLHLDKNPAYNLTIPVLLRFFPDIRLLVALRDPRDVVLSCYLRFLPLNSVSVRFLTLQRTAERYAVDMHAWLKFRQLVAVPWCELRYEDAVDDLPAVARRALQTLGLPWRSEVLDYRARVREKQINSPTYADVAQPVYRTAVGRWQHYQKYLDPVWPILEPFVREFGYE